MTGVETQADPAAHESTVGRFVPGAEEATHYRREWLKNDLVAGLVLSSLLVPQGMAYAELAGLPPITGLYTSMLCLVAYAVFGPSRVLVLGPDSSLGPMIAATILPLAGAHGDPARAIALASTLALLVGLICCLTGFARLGFIADLLSKPTQIGYLTGLALTIVVGQLPKLLGFSVSGSGLIEETKGLVAGVADGDVVAAAAIVGVTSIVLIVVLGRLLPKFPVLLLTVAASIAAVALLGLTDHGVKVVGVLPEGLPSPAIPHISSGDFGILLAGAVGISLVALTDTISTSSAFASKRGVEVRSNQEMIGIGASNLAAGMFQGFAVSTSGSRTAVADRAGAKTQLTGVVGAAMIALMLVFAPGLLRNLAQPTLAAIVITASISLADLPGMRRLWQLRRLEFAVAVVAFLGVALLGVLVGIAVAVALSILNVFRRAWWPYETVLGRVEGIDGYHDIHTYPDAQQDRDIIVYRFDAPLFFANTRTFNQQVRALCAQDPPPRCIVLASAAISDVDTTAAAALAELIRGLGKEGVTLVFAELKDPVREKVQRYEATAEFPTAHFYPTVETAVAAMSKTPVKDPGRVGRGGGP